MATKAEFLGELEARYTRVSAVERMVQQADFDSRVSNMQLYSYRVAVFDTYVDGNGNVLGKPGAVLFHVLDEGLAGETVVLHEVLPGDIQPRPKDTSEEDDRQADEDTFRELVENWLAANAPTTMPVWLVLESNAGKKFATVRVFEAQGSTPETYADVTYFIYQQEGGQVKFGRLVS